jgi:hypothetical protein
MYVSGKMTSVETIPGMRGEVIKENDAGGEFKYDILDILLRMFINATMYPTQNNNKKRTIYTIQR